MAHHLVADVLGHDPVPAEPPAAEPQRLADSGLDLAGVDEAVLMRIEAADMARALDGILGAAV